MVEIYNTLLEKNFTHKKLNFIRKKIKTLKMELRTPKGTIDFHPQDSELLEHIINTSVEVFKLYNAQPLDTPTFELNHILSKKYGDDTKLVFDLADQGGDICSLRYDLTVPLSRYIAQHNIAKIRRYQIGKVFRRDQPYITKGRYREFVQCDYDIVGEYKKMTSEAEILKIMHCILKKFKIGNFDLKINSRRLLFSILSYLSIEDTQHIEILRIIDKKDDVTPEELVNQLTKFIQLEKAEKILKFINLEGLKSAKESEIFKNSEIFREEIENFELLFEYLEAYNCLDGIKIDFSLCRGADYYTGLIFEAVYTNYKHIGSVMGGGRYDNLVDIFKHNRKTQCIGFSVGVYRIFSILKNQKLEKKNKTVLVATMKKEFIKERIELMEEMRMNNIRCMSNFVNRVNLGDQIKYAKKNNIDIVVAFGEDEVLNGKIILIENEERKEILRSELISYLVNK